MFLPAVAAGWTVEHLWSGRSARRLTYMSEDALWGAVRIMLVSAIVLSALVGAMEKLRRRKILSIQKGELIVLEFSPFSPIHLRWPIGSVARFAVVDEGRRAKLLMTTTDGQTAELLTNESARDVRMVFERLVEECRAGNHPAGEASA